MANSLLGSNITPNGVFTLSGRSCFNFNIFSTIGAKYANVFPQPVSAAMITFSPAQVNQNKQK